MANVITAFLYSRYQRYRRQIWVIAGAILLLAVLWILWQLKPPAQYQPSGGIPANFQFHEYEGEKLVAVEEAPPINDSNKVCSVGRSPVSVRVKDCKTYELKMTFDKPYISPIPGSEITIHLELWENGKKINRAGTEALRSAVSAYDDIGVNVWAYIEATSLKPVHPSPVSVNGQRASIRAYHSKPGLRASGYDGYLPNQYRQNIWDGHIYSGDILPLPGPNLPETDEPFDPYWVGIDLTDGDADLTWVFSGVRALPYVTFGASISPMFTGNDEGGTVITIRSVWFGDQLTTRSAGNQLSRINKTEKADFYYDIIPRPRQLASGKPSRLQLEITSRRRNGTINDDPFQRVLVRAYPATTAFQVTSASTYSYDYGVMIPGGTKQIHLIYGGNLALTTYGQFTNAANPSDSQPLSAATSNSLDNQLIEVTLSQGRATVTYEYNGEAGNHSAIIFQVSPIHGDTGNLRCWRQTEGYASSTLDLARAACREEVEARLKTLPTLPEAVRTNIGLLPQYMLYGNQWYPLEDKREIEAYTIKAIPIN